MCCGGRKAGRCVFNLLLESSHWKYTVSSEDKSMSWNDAYIQSQATVQERDEIASHWDLELQDTLLDVAAVMAATESKPAAARFALALHWSLHEPVQRTN
jgi:hypothetical protein